jgi:ribosome-binding ATPase YchF (GTP1/OBG family)
MKIGIVGYQGSGKSTLFEWLTGIRPDPALAHTSQSAMSEVPDPRIDPLVAIYHPKKITRAALELVDTPGLNRTHEGNAARLGLLREAGCLVLVVAAFGGADPVIDLKTFEDDLLLADLQIVANRVERLEEGLRKPKPGREREQDQHELAQLRPLLAVLEAGKPLRETEMTDEQVKATRSFRLFSEKPRMVVINLADDDDPARFHIAGGQPASSDEVERVAIPLGLELELARMEPADRAEFVAEMGLNPSDRDHLLRRIMSVSGQFLYFTAGEKEVRTWMLHKGGTALEAADNIHSDLARGFIRAEVMRAEDLIRLGSEREIKAHNLLRQEPKDYVVVDGDILHIKFSV